MYNLESKEENNLRRFLAKIDKNSDKSWNNTNCWEWLGAKNGKGYGNFIYWNNENNLKRIYVHRFSHQVFIGPIPYKFTIHHKCKTKNCVNPEHLQACSYKDHSKKDGNGAKTHCKHGHEFTLENTYISKEGHRYCKICRLNNLRKNTNYNGGMANKIKTHCIRGHLLQGDNLYINRDGSRHCKECRRINERRRYQENKNNA